MSGATLSQLLEVLGHTGGEHIAICHQRPGHTFTPAIVDVDQAATRVKAVADGADVWFGVNPVQPGSSGRGTADQVTRWAALYADLDAKQGGLPDLATAQAVVDTLTDLLGTRPAALTFSGHGLQPFWAIDPDDPAATLDTEQKRAAAQATLRRFGRLVTAVAERHHGAVDSVYDLARVLRAPGTHNHKGTPVPVVTVLPGGSPLTVDQVLEILDAYGIPHLTDDDQTTGAQISDPTGWAHGTQTCGYAKTMIDGWNTDNPSARHPWFVAQATRLAAAHRNGCLTPTDHTRAVQALNGRLEQLLATGDKRALSPGELADGHAWGRARAAAMTDTHLARELGSHVHLIPGDEPSRPVPPATQPATNGALATVHALDPKRAEPHLKVVEETTLDRSDDGNALLLIDRFGPVLRYCPDRGAWLAWDGHRWHWCDRTGGVVREYAKRVARALPSDTPAAAKHKRSSLSAGGTSAILAQAATDNRISVAMDELDAHPLLLNTPGGIVDLATAQLGPADPAQLHTRAATVAPDFDQPTPQWDEFLADTFAGHDDLTPFVQRLAGYSATGVVTHHVMPFLFGPGGNGKSVFLDVARALLGDYAATAPAKFLMTGQQQHETEIARLSGLRLVICSEVNQTDRFDEAKVKILTGGDALTARFMRADHFTFTPTHKLWLMGNHQPRVSGGGDSFWRRLRMIVFGNTVPAEKQVEGLADRLVQQEGPGILAWIIRGARDVLTDGLNTPASVLAATGAYASEEDSLAQFVSDRCHIGGGPHVRVPTGDLRGAYEQWCREEGETPLNSTAFGRELRMSHGIEQTRSNGRRYYTGLTLLAPEHDDTDDGAPAPEGHWSDR